MFLLFEVGGSPPHGFKLSVSLIGSLQNRFVRIFKISAGVMRQPTSLSESRCFCSFQIDCLCDLQKKEYIMGIFPVKTITQVKKINGAKKLTSEREHTRLVKCSLEYY